MHAILSNFANNLSNDQMPQLWTSFVLYDVYAHVRLYVCHHMRVCATSIHNNTNINIHATHAFCAVPTNFELTQMGRTVRMRADDIIHECDITVTFTNSDLARLGHGAQIMAHTTWAMGQAQRRLASPLALPLAAPSRVARPFFEIY